MGQVELAEAALRALPDLLAGRTQPMEVLFPGSSLERVAAIYRGNELSAYFNGLVGQLVREYIAQSLHLRPDGRVRILEIGAGTGATTEGVVRELTPFAAAIDEYSYTDVSSLFLAHGKRQFRGRAPHLHSRRFDVEQPLAAQHLSAGSYDVVIATDVLHATRDITTAVRNAKAALKRNGLLVLNEMSGPSLFAHVTFGLLDGWWRCEDPQRRMPGCPGLDATQWRATLQSAGFRHVQAPASQLQELGHQLVIAESDGAICQPAPQQATDPARAVRAKVAHEQSVEPARPTALRARALEFLRSVLADVLKLRPEQIDPREHLGRYGIDSLIAVQLADTLRRSLHGIRSTLFYEHQTLQSLTDQLLVTHQVDLARVVGIESAAAPPANDHRIVRDVATPAGEREVRSRDIAIIGIAGSYPQAPTLAAFWENLRAARSSISEIPPERWPLAGFYEPDADAAVECGRSYSKWLGLLEDAACFDPLFFGITPLEAAGMDPQERLFLQASWAVLEDAGYTRERLQRQHQGSVGVFAGITRTGFALHGGRCTDDGEPAHAHTSFGSAANRVSYLLNLSGPSMPIDTLCSSSLTAVHEACEHLRREECALAIAGGVNLYSHPCELRRALHAAHAVARADAAVRSAPVPTASCPARASASCCSSRCRRRSPMATGSMQSSAATSVNHGGRTNGYTVPNPQAQRELVRAALRKAQVDARQVGYIEAHGTGTASAIRSRSRR